MQCPNGENHVFDKRNKDEHIELQFSKKEICY